MADPQLNDAPDEVPNWYLYSQNREIQQMQLMIISLLGLVLAYVAVAITEAYGGSVMSIGAAAAALMGLVIAVMSVLKLLARDPDGYSRRVCDRLGINSWVDAEAKIAERNAQADGGEDQ